jgi:hypothetical protein
MRFEKSQYLEVRANAHNPAKVRGLSALPEHETATDSEGQYIRKRTKPVLIERLLMRAGVTKPLPAPKRRGRPVGSTKVKGVAV